MKYETPAIVELGAVADFTQADSWDLAYDGAAFHKRDGGGGSTTS